MITAYCDDTQAAKSKMAAWVTTVQDFKKHYDDLIVGVSDAANISTALSVCKEKLEDQGDNIKAMLEAAEETSQTFRLFMEEVDELDSGDGMANPYANLD